MLNCCTLVQMRNGKKLINTINLITKMINFLIISPSVIVYSLRNKKKLKIVKNLGRKMIETFLNFVNKILGFEV